LPRRPSAPTSSPLLHQRLVGAAPVPLALAGAGQLEVDGVRGGQLLRPLDEGRRLVLVVGPLGLREQLADLVDQPLDVTLRAVHKDAHLHPLLAVADPQGQRRLLSQDRPHQREHDGREGRPVAPRPARRARRRGAPARAAPPSRAAPTARPGAAPAGPGRPGCSQCAERAPAAQPQPGARQRAGEASTSGSASTRPQYLSTAARSPKRRSAGSTTVLPPTVASTAPRRAASSCRAQASSAR
jgi:hypothetical protein